MSEELDYVGRCEHGVLMLWVSARSGKTEINREVREWLARGGSVERRSVEYAKEHLATCEVCKQQREDKQKANI